MELVNNRSALNTKSMPYDIENINLNDAETGAYHSSISIWDYMRGINEPTPFETFSVEKDWKIWKKVQEQMAYSNDEPKENFNLFDYISNIRNINSENYYLERIDINLQHSGCNGTLHIDSSPIDITAKTYMLMVNPVWEKEWGGKFQLYSEDKSKVLEEYDYVPGRIIIFPSNLPHRGFGADINYPYVYRYSIVFGVKDLFIFSQ